MHTKPSPAASDTPEDQTECFHETPYPPLTFDHCEYKKAHLISGYKFL